MAAARRGRGSRSAPRVADRRGIRCTERAIPRSSGGLGRRSRGIDDPEPGLSPCDAIARRPVVADAASDDAHETAQPGSMADPAWCVHLMPVTTPNAASDAPRMTDLGAAPATVARRRCESGHGPRGTAPTRWLRSRGRGRGLSGTCAPQATVTGSTRPRPSIGAYHAIDAVAHDRSRHPERADPRRR
jgi:hypothetical protein